MLLGKPKLTNSGLQVPVGDLMDHSRQRGGAGRLADIQVYYINFRQQNVRLMLFEFHFASDD